MSRRLVPLGLGLGPASLLGAAAEAAYREAETALLRKCFSRQDLHRASGAEMQPAQPVEPGVALVQEC